MTNIRWRRWLAGVAVLFLTYTLAGFWLVPQALRAQLPRLAQSELARRASVGDVTINPYTLRLEARDLRLTEAGGAPLLAIDRLAVDLQWKSVLRRAWSFAEIRFTAPSASLLIEADGKFNFAELLATLQRPPQTSAADDSLPRLEIESLSLDHGTVAFNDRRNGFSKVVSAIDFALTNFSTLPGQSGTYSFSAQAVGGGKLRWKGELSVAPLHGSGELALEDFYLPDVDRYLKSITHASVAAGRLSARLPYRFSYADGKFDAGLSAASLGVQELALTRRDAAAPFATLARLDMNDISADLGRRELTVGAVHAANGQLNFVRNSRGEVDLANLMVTPAAVPTQGAPVVVDRWKLALKQIVLDQMALGAVDETRKPALKLLASPMQLRLQLAAEQAGPEFKLKLDDADFSVAGLSLARGAKTAFKLGLAGFTDGSLELPARRVSVGRLYATGADMRLTRDPEGRLDALDLLPELGAGGRQPPAPAASAEKPWSASAKSVELGQFGAEIQDQGSGVKVQVQNLAVKLEGASSDLQRPVKFDASLNLRTGGQVSAHGSAVPASAAMQAELRIQQLALAPLQPLLGRYLKLKIAGGKVSAQGRVSTGAGTAQSAALSYLGGFGVNGLVLNEEDGDLFASWKNLGADRLSASLKPNRLDIPELRLVEPVATLIIEDDRSFNAARLLVPAGDAEATAQAPQPVPAPTVEADPFAVLIHRLRVQDGKLDFTDLSLRPQFSAKIFELGGAINGLSSSRDARSQVELDGRVDEFGLARIRGELNPFVPRDNTDIAVLFKNVDMVSVSPYTAKFAGYKIAEGRISLDLQYKLRNSRLEGENQIVIDKLTLGERVDSPDAFKLPIELAIAILKDSDGRIDLGLPVSGDLSDPQFSYGAIVWKAVGNMLTRLVTAPFRALGGLFGISGEKLESIDFDPGSDRLLPPEREKLAQVALLLAKRAQLRLSVPAAYSEAQDGAALRARALRAEIAARAGLRLEPGEEPGPIDASDGAVRVALRALYAERFGTQALEKQRKAAEDAAARPAETPSAADPKTASAQQPLPLWQRVGKMVQGEPQVADASAFYRQLQQALEQGQSLAADALTTLGTRRATAIVSALTQAGADAQRTTVTVTGELGADAGTPVRLKLGLSAK